MSRGLANATGTMAATNLPLFAAGLVLAGYVAITLAAALSVAFRGDRQRSETGWRGIALRALGGWAAAAGLMMTGFTLAQAGTG